MIGLAILASRLKSRLLCLVWGHDITECTSGGVRWWRCVECGKWGRR